MSTANPLPNLDELARQMAAERARLMDAWLRVWTMILFPGKTPQELLELAKAGRITKVVRTDKPDRTELHVDSRFVAFIEIKPSYTAPKFTTP